MQIDSERLIFPDALYQPRDVHFKFSIGTERAEKAIDAGALNVIQLEPRTKQGRFNSQFHSGWLVRGSDLQAWLEAGAPTTPVPQRRPAATPAPIQPMVISNPNSGGSNMQAIQTHPSVITSFDHAVWDIQNRFGLDRISAVREVARRQPALHKEALLAANAGRPVAQAQIAAAYN